ncbi:hypothetical protein Golob_012522, partial [Gossypium lobatum]|nr:hypothetical protein [Gossypium lobatum]
MCLKLKNLELRALILNSKAPSLGILLSEFFEDIDSSMLEENEEETVINDVHIDGNNQKRKTP